ASRDGCSLTNEAPMISFARRMIAGLTVLALVSVSPLLADVVKDLQEANGRVQKLRANRQFEEARKECSQMRAILERNRIASTEEYWAYYWETLALVEQECGDLPRAQKCLEDALAIRKAQRGERPHRYLKCLAELAEVHRVRENYS